MDPGWHVTLTMGLTHGGLILLGLRELWLLRRGRWRPDPEPPREIVPVDGGSHPVAPPVLRPLPECLVPRPVAARRPRVLEDA